MASVERRGKRVLMNHHTKVRELVKQCLAEMDGKNESRDIQTYKNFRNKWKFHCRLVNSDPKEPITLQESAFDTYMDQVAGEIRMRRKVARTEARKNRPGVLNVFFGAIVNLFKK